MNFDRVVLGIAAYAAAGGAAGGTATRAKISPKKSRSVAVESMFTFDASAADAASAASTAERALMAECGTSVTMGSSKKQVEALSREFAASAGGAASSRFMRPTRAQTRQLSALWSSRDRRMASATMAASSAGTPASGSARTSKDA